MLGLAGLSIFPVRHQVLFIVAVDLSKVTGIAIMLESIQRRIPYHPDCRMEAKSDDGQNGAFIVAPVILAGQPVRGGARPGISGVEPRPLCTSDGRQAVQILADLKLTNFRPRPVYMYGRPVKIHRPDAEGIPPRK